MTTVVIVAAGRGTRMGPGVDKLFLEVAGRPVVAHTWWLFERALCVDALVLVVREGMQGAFVELANEQGFRKPFKVVAGGRERQDSVWNGLMAVEERTDMVAIHDGARPCTAVTAVESTLAAARRVGAAVTGHRVVDTLKEGDEGGRVVRTVDRTRLWAVQTPQAFRVEVLRRALVAVREGGLQVTDDTAACEAIGQPVELVASAEPNPKVTMPSDLPYVGWLLGGRATD